jgi:phage baseplate assembly protein gpV
MRKIGYITEIDADKGYVKVFFKEDDITSGWLSIITRGTKGTKEFFPYESGEQVVCLMDETCTDGEVIGARFNSQDKPEDSGLSVSVVKYKDGSLVKYDSAAHEFTIKVGASEFVVNEAGGFRIKKGGETLYGIINDLLTELTTETHTGNLGYPTTPPINAPAYASIMARLQTLLIP